MCSKNSRLGVIFCIFQDYVNTLKLLPERDLPAYFGLPENIGRAWEKQTSSEIVTKLKTILLTKEVSLKFDREYWQKSLSPFMIVWKKLNQGHDFVRMNLPGAASNSNSSVENFVSEEFQNGVRLIQKIHKCFAILNKICKGNAIPDDQDLIIGVSLIKYEVSKVFLYKIIVFKLFSKWRSWLSHRLI